MDAESRKSPDPLAHPPTDSELEDEDENSNAETTDEEPLVESLVAGRERRRNAGNRMATAIAHEGPADADEDEELNAIFAEGADDAEFEDADAIQEDDDDDDSSSDDEDRPGADDDLAGEKELKKQERAEQKSQKRKAGKGMPVPLKKRVKIQAPAETEEERRKRRKKSDRVSWVPSEADQPTRVSSRTLSVQNKTRTLASIKESSRRAEKTREKMKLSEAKKKALEKPPMTQADRIAEATRMEKINAKSVHRWEEQEQERLERQREELERLRNKKLEGPVIRWYSGPAEWSEHYDPKEDRPYSRISKVGREDDVLTEESTTAVEEARKPKQISLDPQKEPEPEADQQGASQANTADPSTSGFTKEGGLHAGSEIATGNIEQARHQDSQPAMDGDTAVSAVQDAKRDTPTGPTAAPAPHEEIPSFLQGIEEYAAMESSSVTAEQTVNSSTVPTKQESTATVQPSPAPEPSEVSPAAAAGLGPTVQSGVSQPASVGQPSNASVDEELPENQTAASLLAAFAPRTGNAASRAPSTAHPLLSVMNPTAASAPPPKPVDKTPKYHSGQAQTVTLVNFSDAINKQPDALRRIIYGSHYVPPEKGKASEKNRKGPTCVVTNHQARYRDPTTGLPYAGKEAFQMLRRLVRGVSNVHDAVKDALKDHKSEEKPVRWSTLLEAWVGKDGLAAGGVPPGFLYGTTPIPVEEKPKTTAPEQSTNESRNVPAGNANTVSAAPEAASIVKTET